VAKNNRQVKRKAHASAKSGKVFGRATRYRGDTASWQEMRAMQRGIGGREDVREHAPTALMPALPSAPQVTPDAVAARMAAGESLTQIAVALTAPLAEVRSAWQAACRREGAR
jgi:hypothetical protein